MTRRDVGSSVAAAVATLLGSLALAPVFTGGAWFPPVLATVVVVFTGGLLLRTAGPAAWSRLSGGRPVPARLAAAGVPLVPIGQLALVCCLLTALYAPEGAWAGVFPTRTSLVGVGQVLFDGASELGNQSTPALPLRGLLALTVVLVGFVAVAVDLVAVGGGQPALAGLGLLILYCVPVSTIVGGIGLTALAAPSAGLALLLWADQRRRLARRSRSGRRTMPGTGGLLAVRTGALALVAAVVVGALVPTLTEGALANRVLYGSTVAGGSGGRTSATGTSLDPVAELHGDLTRPDPIPLLSVAASVPDPGYLRAVTLDHYDAQNGWTLTNLDGQESIAGSAPLAPLPAAEPSREVAATITALQHDDRWLPLPYSPQTVSVSGGSSRNWRFDPTTSTVFGRTVTTRGLRWTVDAEQPEPSQDLLEQSAALPATDPVQVRYTALPALDPSVTALVTQLTATATTPYERVRAIHAFLTDRANGFVYSLSTTPGTSGDDLADFLRLRRGYCEQYAGAMAVMVRAAGVPARVALGYTPGTVQPDGTRQITSDDAHAWVEVWFDGLGWVPFDPTPIEASRAVDLPWAPRADTPQAPDAPAPAPVATAPGTPGGTVSNGETDTPTTLADPRAATGSRLVPALVWAGGVLVVLALVGAPALLRWSQRRRRLADGSAAAVWDELSATAVDLGVGVPAASTPRQTARRLGQVVPGVAAVDALRRLAVAEETASYARPGTEVPRAELAAALRTARQGMLQATSLEVRARALLWPASLVAGTGPWWARTWRRLEARARRRTRPA